LGFEDPSLALHDIRLRLPGRRSRRGPALGPARGVASSASRGGQKTAVEAGFAHQRESDGRAARRVAGDRDRGLVKETGNRGVAQNERVESARRGDVAKRRIAFAR
jgi:hypothetical protein